MSERNDILKGLPANSLRRAEVIDNSGDGDQEDGSAWRVVLGPSAAYVCAGMKEVLSGVG